MQIQINGREVKPSNRLREHIQRRLNFALHRFAPHIRKLHVQVRDLNGPRGGVDKSCRLKIFFISGTNRVLEERAPSAYLAINSLVDRAATSIARRLQRKHDHRRASLPLDTRVKVHKFPWPHRERVKEPMKRPRAKLLIADCHEDTLIVLQRVLEDAAYDTTAVWTASEFVDAIHSQVFDLVLINEYMPGGRCQELLQLLREADLRCVLLQARPPADTGPATSGAEHVNLGVCKHDYPEIVRVVSELLADGEKPVSAA